MIPSDSNFHISNQVRRNWLLWHHPQEAPPVQPHYFAWIPVDTMAAVLWGVEAADSMQLPGALSAASAAAQQEVPWILAYQ